MTICYLVGMRSETLKRKQVRVYFDESAEKHLAQIATKVKTLSESAIVTEILASALDAIAANGYRIGLPMRFQIMEDDKK